MRRVRRAWPFLLLSVGVVCSSSSLRAQAPSSGPMPLSNQSLQLQVRKQRIWTISGHVIALSGRPIGGARVRVQVSAQGQPPRVLETNLLGEFRTEYTFDANDVTSLNVDLAASKGGYTEGHEDFLIRPDTDTQEIMLALAEEEKDSGILPLESLISSLGPRLKSPAAIQQVPVSVRKQYQQAVEVFWSQRRSDSVIPLLKKSVAQEASCLNCRLALSLAYFTGGSWISGDRQLAQVKEMADSKGMKTPDCYLLLGVYDTWLHHEKEAAGYLLEGLKLSPSDALLLTELGRTQLQLENWPGAEEVLGEAIKAGASPDARLLRARALLEAGDAEEAAEEMKAYLGPRQPRDLPPAPRRIYLQLKERLELKAYGRVKSVVTESPEQLMKSISDLKGLEPARNQDELVTLLARVGERVEAFFRTFPNTVSTEEIHQESLRRDGSVQEVFDEKAYYLLLAQKEEWGLGLSEYRTYRLGTEEYRPTTPKPGFMRTSGFASTSLVLHPQYQAGSTFRYLGTQVLGGRSSKVIAFAQDPNKAQMIGRFDAQGVSSPLLVQGVAWVDTENYSILRMHTELLKPLSRVRLSRETTEIQFGQVSFKDIAATLWLPQEVAVTVVWKGKVFHNVHRYTDFKLFNVQAEERRRSGTTANSSTPKPN